MARREAMRLLGIASVAASFPGFSQWVFAGTGTGPDSLPLETVPRSYRTLFFSNAHFRLVEHISELIIPEDDTPGARQAGVAEFIDFMVANRVPISGAGHLDAPGDSATSMGSELQRQWLEGLDWINAHCQSEFGRAFFLECDGTQQNALLSALAYKAQFTSATEAGREFFQLMRDYTVAGYYTSRIGLESLGFPGLRSAWLKPPGCPHVDDPEHLKLHAP